jgi:uncharacterized protein with NAD-binding domain and iron-sulfur cluster
MASLPRIAILGGGAGSVTAAFELSQRGWDKHYASITLYQQGWRLGGKGASGRGRDLRIEEHGLHIWFGFYENAFRMLYQCHAELEDRALHQSQPRWPLPFTRVEDSFRKCSEITVTDYDGCGWKSWVADFFEDSDDRPWADPDLGAPGERSKDWTVVFYLVRCLRLAADLSWSLVRSEPGLEIVTAPTDEPSEAVPGLDVAVRALRFLFAGDAPQLLGAAADALDAVAAEAVEQRVFLDVLDLVIRALDLVVDFLRGQYDELVRRSDGVRRAWYVVDILLAIVRGVIEDGVIAEEDFSVIDDVDFCDWLLAHGAARESVDCALVRAVVYDLAFGYEGGDPQRPSCGAGTALRGLLRTFFTYRGALMWKMNAGMGDVVFAPLYELLVKRGVDVRFFHRVEAVRSANGAVDEIEIDVQAVVPDDTDPSAYLGSLPGSTPLHEAWDGKAVWPASPAELLKRTPGAGTPLPAEFYESWFLGRSAAKVSTRVLRRGANDGFDLVVFGLPIGCVPYVAPDLVAHSNRWKAAVEHLRTVPTQAMQLWLDLPVSKLGAVPGAVVGGFVEPFDTWADMPQLVHQEKVPGSETVAYFCNVLADAPAPVRGQAEQWLKDQRTLVRFNALRFLTSDIGTLWPLAVDPLTRKLHWDILVDPDGTTGQDRLNAQYLRANVEPSERYVLSVPGSSAHRIPPGDTGFENLYAVGDWTSCILDAGCVEAAVISGMRAANRIRTEYGDSACVKPILGEENP